MVQFHVGFSHEIGLIIVKLSTPVCPQNIQSLPLAAGKKSMKRPDMVSGTFSISKSIYRIESY